MRRKATWIAIIGSIATLVWTAIMAQDTQAKAAPAAECCATGPTDPPPLTVYSLKPGQKVELVLPPEYVGNWSSDYTWIENNVYTAPRRTPEGAVDFVEWTETDYPYRSVSVMFELDPGSTGQTFAGCKVADDQEPGAIMDGEPFGGLVMLSDDPLPKQTCKRVSTNDISWMPCLWPAGGGPIYFYGQPTTTSLPTRNWMDFLTYSIEITAEIAAKVGAKFGPGIGLDGKIGMTVTGTLKAKEVAWRRVRYRDVWLCNPATGKYQYAYSQRCFRLATGLVVVPSWVAWLLNQPYNGDPGPWTSEVCNPL